MQTIAIYYMVGVVNQSLRSDWLPEMRLSGTLGSTHCRPQGDLFRVSAVNLTPSFFVIPRSIFTKTT